MRWFIAIAALGVGSACGRLGFGDGDDGAPADAAAGSPDARTPRLATPIGGLSPIATAVAGYDLAGTATPTGFTLTRVLLTGSDVYGVNLDDTMVPDSDWRVIKSGGNFIRTTVAWTGSMMTTTTANDPYTWVKRFLPDLTSDTITDEAAGLGGKTSLTKAGIGRWYWALVDGSRLHVVEIATDGSPTGPTRDLTNPATGTPIAASISGNDQLLFAVWSVFANECLWATITPDPTMGQQSGVVTAACNAPRVTASTGGGAHAVFDDGTGIWHLELSETGAATPHRLHDGTAPRIVSAGGVEYLAFTVGGGLGLVSGPDPSALGEVPIIGLPQVIDAYELVPKGTKVYLFVLGGQQTFWADVTY